MKGAIALCVRFQAGRYRTVAEGATQFGNEAELGITILCERGGAMNSTFAIPMTNGPLPYVPELPADFVMMLKKECAKDDAPCPPTMDRAAA